MLLKMKPTKQRSVTFLADEDQIRVLRRTMSLLERRSVSEQIREAVTEYLARQEKMRREVPEGGVRRRAGAGKTPPRILFHLEDPKRLERLRLHARTLKGTHRTVGRVIRLAIDQYLEAHARDLAEFLRRRQHELGPSYRSWKCRVTEGKLYGGRG